MTHIYIVVNGSSNKISQETKSSHDLFEFPKAWKVRFIEYDLKLTGGTYVFIRRV